jgi:hypothetical protein
MPARTISRLATTGLVAGVLSVALAVPALATPNVARPALAPPTRDCDCGGARVPTHSGNVTNGTDVAAPDQQNPIPAPTKPVLASAPTWPLNPQPLPPVSNVSASVDSGFQWDDAGIGAGGALVVLLTGVGAMAIVRRRQITDPPLAA